jgi:D-sedoheptulose 7-phosphate isomerase
MEIYNRQKEQRIYTPIQTITTCKDYHNQVVATLADHRIILDAALTALTLCTDALTDVAIRLVETLHSGHKVLAIGNGGSAAEAQHFVAELVGRFKQERAPYAAIALTSDSATLTAIANDYGYEDVFARQICALSRPGDLLVAFSTSGESENMVRAAQVGRRSHIQVVAITGANPSRLASLAHVVIPVPGVDTATIQELHMVITHLLCDITESQLIARDEQSRTDLAMKAVSIVTGKE